MGVNAHKRKGRYALKIPRVTIVADFDEDVSVGEVNTAALGYGLHQAWIYSTMFGTNELFGVTTIANGTSFSSIYLISLIVNFISLVVLGILDAKIVAVSIRRYPMVFSAVITSVGTALIFFCGMNGAAGLGLTFCSAILTGFGSAILLLCWGTVFARMTLTSNIMNTILAFVVAVFVYVGLTLLPVPVGGVVIITLPLFEAVLVWQHAAKPYHTRRKLPFFNPLPVNRGRFYLAFGLPMLFFGVALGFIRETSMTDVVSVLAPNAHIAPLIISELIAAVVLAGGLAFMRSDRIEDYLRPTIPLISLAMVFIPLEIAFDGPVAKTAVLSGYICFESVLWVVFGAFSQRYRLSPILVFGMGRGMLGFGAFLGLFLASYIGDSAIIEASNPYSQTTMAMVALVCIVLAQSLLPRERDIRRVVLFGNIDEESIADQLNLRQGDPARDAKEGQGSIAEDRDEGESDKVVGFRQPEAIVDSATDVIESSLDEAPDSDIADAITGESARDEIVADTRKADEAVAFRAAATEGNADPDAGSREPGQAANQEAARNDDEVDGRAFASNRYRNSRLMPAVIMAAEAAEESEPKKGFFRRKCETVANQYLLSARETEVLFYLAKGYNSAYLQEKLYISEGTAKTHIRHIYGKVNVHSQQELMRIVNETWV